MVLVVKSMPVMEPTLSNAIGWAGTADCSAAKLALHNAMQTLKVSRGVLIFMMSEPR